MNAVPQVHLSAKVALKNVLDNQPAGYLDRQKDLDLSDNALTDNKETEAFVATLIPNAVTTLAANNIHKLDKPKVKEVYLAVQWEQRKGSMGALREVYEDDSHTKPAKWIKVLAVPLVFWSTRYWLKVCEPNL